jgi:transposase
MDRMPHDGVVCGVDTHANTHTAAVLDGVGRILDVQQFNATAVGYCELTSWAQSFGTVIVAGVEGTSSYGKGLTRHLEDNRVEVVEVIRPNRQTRRRNGKSDPKDAIAAARAVLSGEASGVPKAGNGPVEAVRALMIARSSSIKARTQAGLQIRDLVRTAPARISDRLSPLPTNKRVDACTRMRVTSSHTVAEQGIRTALRSLAKRHQRDTVDIDELTNQIAVLVTEIAPTLCALKGVGPIVAANLLICAGDNPDRLGTDAAFAAVCGVSPVDTSSGLQTHHRLNRGGNRQANSALWSITMNRMSNDQRTRDYVQRRTADGLGKRSIMRCLKRYIARETHKAIIKDLQRIA